MIDYIEIDWLLESIAIFIVFVLLYFFVILPILLIIEYYRKYRGLKNEVQ